MRYTFQSNFSAIVLKRDAENENAAITLAEQAVKGISVSSCTEKQDRFQLEGVYQVSVKSPNEASAYFAAAENWKRSDFSKLHHAMRGDFKLIENSRDTVEREW